MKLSVFVLIFFCFTSCATYKTTCSFEQQKLIIYKNFEKNEKCVSIPRVYSGIFYTSCIMFGHIRTKGIQENICMLPLNFIADTLILPFTVTKQLTDGSIVLKKNLKEK